jgi:hypothetical protein
MAALSPLSCRLTGTLLNWRSQTFLKIHFVRVVRGLFVFAHCLTFRTEHKVPERGFLFIPIGRHSLYFETKALTCTVTGSVDTSTFSPEDRNSPAFRKAGLHIRHKIMVSRYSSVGLRTTFRAKRWGWFSSIPGNKRISPCPSSKPSENSRNPNGCSAGFEYPWFTAQRKFHDEDFRNP